MWTRKELKNKAKETLRLNYWKTVLIALIFTIVCSGAGAFGAASGSGNVNVRTNVDASVTTTSDDALTEEEFDEMLDESENDSIVELPHFAVDLTPGEKLAIFGVLATTFVVLLALGLTLAAFLANPVEVGTARFFTRNLNQKAEVKEIAFGFDNNYRETVKTMILRDLYTILWGMLLIVPGVIKAYEYRMIPYLLADDPTMTKSQAFAQSKRMMDGNKWRAFVLDLSFIGWYLLAIPTLGLVNIFYASPYKKMTDAALYEELRYGNPDSCEGVALPSPTTGATPGSSVPVPPFAAADAPVPVWDDEPADTGDVDGELTDSVVPDEPQA